MRKFIEPMSIRKWNYKQSPGRILVIRIQALGDAFAILPFVYDLKEKHPDSRIDLLVRDDYADLFAGIEIFHQIHRLKGGISARKQLFHLILLWPVLFLKRYDAAADLQRNKYTRWLRRLLLPKAWTEFDRFSPMSALRRNQWSMNQLGLGSLEMNFKFTEHVHRDPEIRRWLEREGWNGESPLVILNPAGAFVTRNWPMDRYAEFISLWLEKKPDAMFVILGVEALREKAGRLKAQFPTRVINLVEKTNLIQAYQIVLSADLMLTEDSGLGHFSWVSGKKTVMLLGSTRSDWTSPFGSHTASFDSSDLPCGDCMLRECVHDKVICMERLDSKTVFSKAWELFIS